MPELNPTKEAIRYRRDLVGKCIKRLYELHGSDRDTWPEAVRDKEFHLIALAPSFGYEDLQELNRWLKQSYTLNTNAMRSLKATPRATTEAQQKSPSYLSRVRGELFNLILTNHAPSEQEAQEITDNLWKLVSSKLAESYWNGVAAGNRGVKPKADRPQPGKSYRLTGGPKDKAISNGNTWAESQA
jgi:hypothetical protein